MNFQQYEKLVEHWGYICLVSWLTITAFLFVSWMIGRVAIALVEVSK